MSRNNLTLYNTMPTLNYPDKECFENIFGKKKENMLVATIFSFSHDPFSQKTSLPFEHNFQNWT